jgi:hypothetical protein
MADLNDSDFDFFDIDYSRAGPGYYHGLPILKKWLPYLAQIVFLWGVFELGRDKFLEKMFVATDIVPPKGWKARKGPKKHRLFLEQADKVFESNPSIREYLHNLIEQAIVVQKKRNALLHGELAHGLSGSEAVLIVCDHANDGSFEEIEFGTADLEDLFHEVSRVAAGLSRLTSPFSTVAGISSSDKLLLQRLLGRGR